MQSSKRRLLWELGLGALALLALYATWEVQEWRADKRLAEVEARWAARLAEQKAETETWAAELAYQQAELVFQAFGAGLRQDLVDGQQADVASAIDLLIRLEPVLFVHVLTPEGDVLGSTDRKLELTGEADERARWALEATDIVVRVGGDDLTEIAGPLRDRDGNTLAVLWLGYDGSGLGARLGAGG